MGKLSTETVKIYPKMTFSRQEILEKLGLDTDDAFYATLVDFGRGGVEFSLQHEARAKYEDRSEN